MGELWGNKKDVDACLKIICYFPRIYENEDKRPIDIYRDSYYGKHYHDISIELIFDKIKADELIVDEWIMFSEDKRWTPAWAFYEASSGKWSVSRIETTGKPSYELIYDNRILACAHMIKFEMEDLRLSTKKCFTY